jgi:hypothetical protein
MLKKKSVNDQSEAFHPSSGKSGGIFRVFSTHSRHGVFFSCRKHHITPCKTCLRPDTFSRIKTEIEGK